jgi:hypothetical protein
MRPTVRAGLSVPDNRTGTVKSISAHVLGDLRVGVYSFYRMSMKNRDLVAGFLTFQA